VFDKCLLGGDSMMPSKLYTRLCHAFLVIIYFSCTSCWNCYDDDDDVGDDKIATFKTSRFFDNAVSALECQ